VRTYPKAEKVARFFATTLRERYWVARTAAGYYDYCSSAERGAVYPESALVAEITESGDVYPIGDQLA
jgi:hypothetical protein